MGFRLEPSSYRTPRGAPACLALALVVTPSLPLVNGEPVPRPPTSMEPTAEAQKVLVSHLHRRVRACAPVPERHPSACARQLGDATAATSVVFEPVTKSVGPSRRQRVVVTFPDVAGMQKQTVELPLGEWSVNWPGCRDAPRLNVTPTKAVSPHVLLRTSSGRCELESSRCRLVEAAVEQRSIIEE